MAVDDVVSTFRSRAKSNMQATPRACLLYLTLLLVVTTAHAQSDPARPLTDARPGLLESPVQLARDAVQILAGQDQSNVSLQFSHGDTGEEDRSAFEQGTEKVSVYEAWSLTLKAPLNKDESNTELATLDGLADAFSGTLKYNNVRLTRRNPRDEELKRYCDVDAEGPSETLGALPPCDLGIAKKVLGEADFESLRGLFFSPMQWAWGGAVTIGTKQYEFLASDTTDKMDERRTPWSAQVFVAAQRRRVGLLTFAVRYEDAYKSGDVTTNCPAPGGAQVVSCVTAPLDEPKKNEKTVATMEFRRSTNLWGAPIAFSPSVNYDFKDSVLGVDVPVYLWSNEKGRLTGGLTAGWRDDEGGINVGLFVGTAFTLSPGK
ncbi:hypothetical protein [Steroidobacter agaridevorans]|uniref:hypothetical protein n=1 Tax=Steroidobacter agaridevorans TaxID=2695856 RepID=UPI001379B856|nr:hypothetical protein [Steroidobacter agaridevorans]